VAFFGPYWQMPRLCQGGFLPNSFQFILRFDDILAEILRAVLTLEFKLENLPFYIAEAALPSWVNNIHKIAQELQT
jgi:hypothetical protein